MAESPFAFDARPRRLFFLLRFKPVAAVFAMGIFVLSGGGVVTAAQSALPGEGLYSVKLASEKARETLAVFPASRFALQATHADRRLREVERLIASGRHIEHERVERALRAYEKDIFRLNAATLRWTVDSSPRADARGIRVAEQVLDRHAALVVGISPVQPALAEAMLAPMDAALDLQAGILEAVAVSNAASIHAYEELRELHAQREKRIQEQLERLRLELQASEPLETSSHS